MSGLMIPTWYEPGTFFTRKVLLAQPLLGAPSCRQRPRKSVSGLDSHILGKLLVPQLLCRWVVLSSSGARFSPGLEEPRHCVRVTRGGHMRFLWS